MNFDRDKRIKFVEDTHTYYIDDKKVPISTTGLISLFFPKFNADLVISKMMKSKKWKDSKYYGMTEDAIKSQWNDSGKDASSEGTKLHLKIEHFYKHNIEIDESNKEHIQFKNFYQDHKYLNPFKFEWRIFDDVINFAGTIDSIFKNNDGTYSIYDWKRSKEIKFENRYDNALEPISHLPDTNYSKYSVQLNIYKYILEKYYDIKIKELYLVQFHPNIENYNKIRVQDMNKETKRILAAYIKNVLLVQ